MDGIFNAKKFLTIVEAELKMQVSRAKTSQQNGSTEQLNHVVKKMYLSGWLINTYQNLVAACQRIKYLNNYQRAIKVMKPQYNLNKAFNQYNYHKEKNSCMISQKNKMLSSDGGFSTAFWSKGVAAM